MLLMPRTGSSFCEEVISRVMPTAMMHSTPAIEMDGFTKHNHRNYMPVDYKLHPVVGVKRNVLDLWVSWYFYGMWDTLFHSEPWPGDISFDKYYRTIESDGRKYIGNNASGGFAGDFYNAMFADSNGKVEDVRFLDFSELNFEVYRLLKECGYDDERILVEPPHNNDTYRCGRHWDSVISEETAELILESEKNGILK